MFVAPVAGKGVSVTKAGRASIFAALLAIVLGLVIFTVMAFLRSSPPTLDFTAGHPAGQPVDLNIQTVGAIGYGDHPTWVSYLAQNPQNQQWVQSTIWKLPAHTLIHVTINQYDSGSPLRNAEIGLITGVNGNHYLLNGKKNISLVNSYNGNGVAHTFSVPSLGINIPLLGVDGTASNFCGGPAPCTTSQEHNTIQFSFTTPGPGSYRFQCFVPCGLSFLYGNGGPMSTVGYMGGFLEVQ